MPVTELTSFARAVSARHRPSHLTKYAAVAVLLTIAFAVVVQMPGLDWVQSVRPDAQISLHPDESRFVGYADRFVNKPSFNYVIGQATHIYVIKETARLLTGQTPDLVQVSRLVSFAYALATVVLVAVIAWELTASALVSASSAALLALSPLHIVNGQIGIADAMASFYTWLALYLAMRHLRAPATATMVLFAAAVGATLSAKFFVPIAVPFAAMVFAQRAEPLRVALMVLVTGFAFLACSFFAFTPWDGARFIYRLIHDAAVITGGHTVLDNVLHYGWGLVPSLGIVGATLTAYGAGLCLYRYGPKAWAAARTHLAGKAYVALVLRPATVVAVTLLLHTALMLTMEFAAYRFMLPLVPALCIVAAIGLADLVQRIRPLPQAGIALVIVVLGYQAYNAVMLEKQFARDVRQSMGDWLAANLTPDDEAVAFMDYARIRGVRGLGNPDTVLPNTATHLATCDLEYVRYLKPGDASEIFHAYGGQPRVDFFRALFSGDTDFAQAASFDAQPFGIEQHLMWDSYISRLVWFIPNHCVVFARRVPDAEIEASPDSR